MQTSIDLFHTHFSWKLFCIQNKSRVTSYWINENYMMRMQGRGMHGQMFRLHGLQHGAQGLAVQRRQLHLFRPQQSFVRSRRTNREQCLWEMLLFCVTKICSSVITRIWLFLIENKNKWESGEEFAALKWVIFSLIASFCLLSWSSNAKRKKNQYGVIWVVCFLKISCYKFFWSLTTAIRKRWWDSVPTVLKEAFFFCLERFLDQNRLEWCNVVGFVWSFATLTLGPVGQDTIGE